MRLRRAIAVAVVILAVAIAAGAVVAATPKHHVTIKGSQGLYHFKPGTITIHKGQSVHWSWSSDAPHNVHFSKHRHSKTAASVSDFKLTFDHTGTFKYRCTVHLFYGKVVVEP